MPAALILQLLATFGPSAVQLIDKLIEQWSTNANVTPEQWADLSASLKQTATDRMKAKLAAAGIPDDDPHAVALLSLSGS